LDKLKSEKLHTEVKNLAGKSDKGSLIARIDNYTSEELRQIALALSNTHKIDFVALIGTYEGQKVSLVVAVNPEKGYKAKEIITEVAPLFGGGGGGSDSLAVAGGKDIAGIKAALNKLTSYTA
jgi:alanyl-tRNA synthetase